MVQPRESTARRALAAGELQSAAKVWRRIKLSRPIVGVSLAVVIGAAILDPCVGQASSERLLAADQAWEALRDDCLNRDRVVLLGRVLSVQKEQRGSRSLIWFDTLRAASAFHAGSSHYLLPQVAVIEPKTGIRDPGISALGVMVVEPRPLAQTEYALVKFFGVAQDELKRWLPWFDRAEELAAKKRGKVIPDLLSRCAVRTWSQNVVFFDNPRMIHNLEAQGFDEKALRSLDTKRFLVAWVELVGIVYPDPPEPEREFPRSTRLQRVRIREVVLGESVNDAVLQVDTEDRAIEISRAFRTASVYDGPRAILQWGRSFLTCIDVTTEPPRVGATLKLLGPEDPAIDRVRQVVKRIAK